MREISTIGSFRLRVGYKKTGRLRYLGHLEVLHTIERVIRRAGLPYAITQGYSPHMRIAFSSAVPVGTASYDEWFDLWLDELVLAPQALERLQKASPQDLMPTCAGYVDMHEQALTAALTRCIYRISLYAQDSKNSPTATYKPLDSDSFICAFNKIASLDSLTYMRGKKEKTMNISNTLVRYDISSNKQGHFVINLDTRSSNLGALRPEVLLNEVEHELGANFPKELFAHCEIDRISQMIELEDGTLVKPLAHPRESKAKNSATFAY